MGNTVTPNGLAANHLRRLAREFRVIETNAINQSLVEFRHKDRFICKERFDVYSRKDSIIPIQSFLDSTMQPTDDDFNIRQIRLEIQKAFEASLEADADQDRIVLVGIADFCKNHPTMREPVIDRLVRRGETCNIIAATKVGKSWMATDLAMSVASGEPWMKEFDTTEGVVVYIDIELHPETFASRLEKVANDRGHDLDAMQKTFIPICLRGTGHDINSLSNIIDQLSGVRLIVLDAWYRLLPGGSSENDNAQMMHLYNTLDKYASQLDCAFVVVHHSSKGEQGSKSVTDVGSGAGAMARAADTHIVIRPHEEEGLSVLDAACRSFPPLEPVSMFFTWPCWHTSTTAPKVKTRQSANEEHKKKADKEAVETIIAEFSNGDDTFTAGDVRTRLGMNKERATRLIKGSDRFKSVGFREPTQARYAKQELFTINGDES